MEIFESVMNPKSEIKMSSYSVKKHNCIGRNRYFSVYFDSIEEGGQPIVNDYLVVQPDLTNEKGVYGVGVLPVMNSRFGLVRVFRHPLRRLIWELPGGFIEQGESSEATAIRELIEEGGWFVLRKTFGALELLPAHQAL